jgi:two-component system, chemotaxis family, protein-glutamate methylesterase/glutaminase
MPGILICDDSATLRLLLKRSLAAQGLAVCGEAGSGEDALQLAAQLKPDLITMDVMLPGMDGFAATQALLKAGAARIVIVSAAGEALQADLSFRALQAGALDLVDKPTAEPGALQAWAADLGMRLRALLDLPLGAKPAGLPKPARPSLARRELQAFGIAASTGGPPALGLVLKDLPTSLPFPILVALHIAPGFTDGLARWLGTQTRLKVKVAESGTALEPGTVWLAHDGQDLLWHSGRARLLPSPGGVCPSGDKLLLSLAHGPGRQAGGAVLTGMGSDGAMGLLALRQAGGLTLAQDAGTCVVDGMPAAAVAQGATETRLQPEDIGFCIAELGRLKGASVGDGPWGESPIKERP